MPALITHYLFGEAVVSSLPAGSVAGQEELAAFLLGCQGPDPFFFHFSDPSKMRATSSLGSAMHSTHMSAFFDGLRAATLRVPASDRGLGEAFSLGMLAHYALDRSAHPLIYAKEYEVLRAGTGLERSGSQVHAFIESELDAYMLWSLRGEATDARPPASFVRPTPRVCTVAGSLLSQVALAVYRVRVAPGLYGASVADMRRVYQLIEPEGSRRSRAIARLERLVRRGDSLLEGLAHKPGDPGEPESANLGRRVWRDAWTGEPSRDSFPDRFNAAAEGFAALADAYVRGADGAKLTGHRDYSGVLLEDESVPAPEPPV